MKLLSARSLLFAASLAALSLAACDSAGSSSTAVTFSEAEAGVEESVSASYASAAVDPVIDVTTEFTLGKAVEVAAGEIEAFAKSQIACATVTRSGAKLTIDFGAVSAGCTYKGRTYGGQAAVEVKKAATTGVELAYTFSDITDGVVTVGGTATVTYSSTATTRTVKHSLSWRYRSTTFTGTGDRTMSRLGTAPGSGVRIDGTRTWTGSRGTWKLTIAGIEAKPDDPVPQAGRYEVTTPAGKGVTMTFTRVDADSIRIEIQGTAIAWKFLVDRKAATVKHEVN